MIMNSFFATAALKHDETPERSHSKTQPKTGKRVFKNQLKSVKIPRKQM